jgi:hypothetical protein
MKLGIEVASFVGEARKLGIEVASFVGEARKLAPPLRSKPLVPRDSDSAGTPG